MWFLWGLLMWFGCHYALNMCLSFSTKYKNTKDGFDLYVAMGTGVACLGATIFAFSYIDKEIAFLIGGAVGFLTGALHFNANVKSGELQKVIMQSTRTKNDDWNSKTFEEKRTQIEKIMNQSMNEMRNDGIDVDKALNEVAQQLNDYNEAVRLYKTPNTRQQAVTIFTRLAEKGHANSQHYLASYLFYFDVDKNKAIEWWEKAAAKGNQSAINQLSENRPKPAATDINSTINGLLNVLHKDWTQEAAENGKSVSNETKIKFSKMFKQSFDNCFSCEKTMLSNIPCNYYLFMPSPYRVIGQFRVMVETLDNPKRFIAAEYSYNESIVLCEWVFDNGKEVKHLNYGPIINKGYEEINFTSHFKRKIEEIL